MRHELGTGSTPSELQAVSCGVSTMAGSARSAWPASQKRLGDTWLRILARVPGRGVALHTHASHSPLQLTEPMNGVSRAFES